MNAMKKSTARDVMSTPVIPLHPQMGLDEATQILVEEKISGAPVVMGADLLGVISLADIAAFIAGIETQVRGIGGFYSQAFPEWDGQDETWQERSETAPGDLLRETRVDDVMSPVIIDVAADAPVETVVRELCTRRIHRVLVTDKGAMVGLITPLDILARIFDLTETYRRGAEG